jgi:hypothetical protein
MNKTFIGGREPRRRYWKYEIALYRGDDEIDHGTIEEIADRRGVQKLTIYYYLMPVAGKRADSRKNKSSGLRAVRTDI